MRKVFVFSFSCVVLLSCGGANDGDARTDTTNMPVDTSVGKASSNTVNSNTGTYPTNGTGRGDDSVSASSPQSRSTTPGSNNGKQEQQNNRQQNKGQNKEPIRQ